MRRNHRIIATTVIALGLTLPAALATTSTSMASPASPASPASDLPAPTVAAAAVTGWTQARYGPAHNARDLHETILTPSTVGGLAPAWSVPVSRPEWTLQSSPSVTGGSAYLATWDGHLQAVDTATGAVSWQRTLTGGQFGTVPVDATSVYTWQADGTLRAYRRSDGHQRWKVAQPNGGGGVPSSSVVLDAGTLYGALGNLVWARDARTGALRWQQDYDVSVLDTYASPTVWRHRLFVVTDLDTLVALDRATGAVLWSVARPGLAWVTPTVGAGGQVFVGSGVDCSMTSIDALTGVVRWSHALSPRCSFDGPRYTALDGTTLVTTTAGDDVVALSATSGVELWRRHLTGVAWAGGYESQPVVADGVVYVVGGSSLWALRESDGALLTTVATAGAFGEPVVWDGTVYTAEDDHALHAYRLAAAGSAGAPSSRPAVRTGPAAVVGATPGGSTPAVRARAAGQAARAVTAH